MFRSFDFRSWNLLVIFLLGFGFYYHFLPAAFCQTKKIDSLLLRLQQTIHDTDRVSTLNTMAWELKFITPDTGILLSRQALALSEKIKWSKGIAESHHYIGVFYSFTGNYLQALEHYQKALAICDELLSHNNHSSYIIKKKSSTLGNIGNLYSEQGDYPKALEYYFKAMKIDEELGNSPDEAIAKSGNSGLAIELGNIGNVYGEQGDYPKALEYFLKALKITEGLGNKNHIAIWLGNIGGVYFYQGEYPKALEYYYKAMTIEEELGNKKGIAIQLGNIGIIYKEQGEAHPPEEVGTGIPSQREGLFKKAMECYSKGLKIAEEIGDKNEIAIQLGNIGIIYKKLGEASAPEKTGTGILSQREEFFNKAMEYYFMALKIEEELGNMNGTAIWLCNIGLLKINVGKFKEAEEYLHKALVLADSIKALSLIQDIHRNLSQLYDTTNNYKLALAQYKKYNTAKDSLFNEGKSKEMGRLEAKYEYDKQKAIAETEHKKELEFAEERERRQRIVIWFIVAVAVAVAVIAVIILRSLRITQKQKRIIESQKRTVEQKQEEILASIRYARRIQNAMMPTDTYIEKILGKVRKK